MFAGLVVGFVAAACGSDGSQPAPGGSGDLTEVTHVLEPTDQMRQAAEQQCIDDPELATGYVKAVAPDTGRMLAELEVDCAELRAGG